MTLLHIEAGLKDCTVILINEFFNENRFENEYLDYKYKKQGFEGSLFIEHFKDSEEDSKNVSSIISFTCDEIICLNI